MADALPPDGGATAVCIMVDPGAARALRLRFTRLIYVQSPGGDLPDIAEHIDDELYTMNVTPGEVERFGETVLDGCRPAAIVYQASRFRPAAEALSAIVGAPVFNLGDLLDDAGAGVPQ
jgi:hypothetical protein